MQTAEQLQRDYYASTAGTYAAQHEADNPECQAALDTLRALLPAWGVSSLLDVGSGVGRVVRHFQRVPGLRVGGIEPVPELIQQAELSGVARGSILEGSGTALPYRDASWDVVTAFGMLHHVARPDLVIAEMLRVAKVAVVISDGNRFGQGRTAARLAKLAMCATGLWPAWIALRTRGRGYDVSEGDGIHWSYSVYDSMAQLRAGSSRLLTLESSGAPSVGPWSLTLLNAGSVLVVALK
jgi:SAM-dependent methyltransferase